MRPRLLRLQAFGPYPEEEVVDFVPLAGLGLFVVAGPTGGGKTTIFDAITYALYGEVPGDRPSTDVRSHHARADVPTVVELEFEIDKRRFKVLRKPSYERPRKRGAGTTIEKAEAELYQLNEQLGWQGIERGPGKVSARCAELIGLSAGQFQRVVLLPQGKFAQLLLARTDEREQLLRQLFGTHLYQTATERMREEARRLSGAVGDVERQVDHHRENALAALGAARLTLGLSADADDADEPPAGLAHLAGALAHVRPVLTEREARAGAARTAAEKARVAHTSAVEVARRFDRHRQLASHRDQLEALAPVRELASERAAAARRAAPVVSLALVVDEAVLHLDTVREAERASRCAIAAQAASLGAVAPASPTEASTLAAQLAERAAGDSRLLAAAADADEQVRAAGDGASECVRALATAQDNHRAAATALELSTAERAPLAALAAQVSALAARAEAARAVVELATRLADDIVGLSNAHQLAIAAERHHDNLFAAFTAGVAPRLAAELKLGDPCPVCGSEDHPHPARSGPDALAVGVDDLESARDAADEARSHRTRVFDRVEQARGDLGPAAELCLDELKAAHQSAQAALAGSLAARQRLVVVDAEVELARVAVHQAEGAVVQARLDSRGAEVRVEQAGQALVAARAAAEGIDPADLTRRVDAIAVFQQAIADWSNTAAASGPASGRADAARQDLSRALGASGFDDVVGARACALSADELNDLEEEIAQWQQQRRHVNAALDELEHLGVPDVRPDLAALASAADVTQQRAAHLTTSTSSVAQRLDDAELALTTAQQLEAGSARIRHERDVAVRVAGTCAGVIAPKVRLEAWVLAGELDQVAAAANVHLKRMSAGRYTLVREGGSDDLRCRTGLDLVVLDAHTGRERSPATLSGGEQFQAALALALGLADVVSRGGSASGRSFEALFVDEGFSTLDHDALDDAIETLDHLQAGGRMVGVITHVDALKQQLRTGIEVRRRADGRGSTIVGACRPRG